MKNAIKRDNVSQSQPADFPTNERKPVSAAGSDPVALGAGGHLPGTADKRTSSPALGGKRGATGTKWPHKKAQ